MSGVPDAGPVERARSAASRGDWPEAYDLLATADADGTLTPADLPVLAQVAYAGGHLDVAIAAWERACAAWTQAGEPVAAAGAAVRVAMHLLFDTALMAPVRGWLARADGLLDGRSGSAAHAWLGAVRAYERMLSGDLTGAWSWARQAVEVGARYDPAACAIGRVAEARLHILDGDVRRGLALLDQAGVATVSGGLDPLSTGVVYCEVVCALQGLGQYDLAEQWTEAMERWSETSSVGSLHGRCRVHRAEILRLRGAYEQAEAEVLEACEELRPYMRRELGWPLSELGRIRLHRGDLAGAEEALLEAHRTGWDPQPGLALVRLAQGDAGAAAGAIRDALANPVRLPWKERPPDSDLQRAPLLEAQVEIELAGGDVDRARSASAELDRIATRFENTALAAAAAVARGRVRLADGDAESAEASLADAVRLWTEVGAPYETAVARMGLADALNALGSDHRAALERHAARAAFGAVGKTPPAAQPSSRPRHEAGDGQPADGVNVFRHQGDFWTVVFDGDTAHVRDLKGMRYLARLLAEPGREYHVLDLVAAEIGPGAAPADGDQEAGRPLPWLGDAGAMLDGQARDAYRRRLAEIDDDIAQARAVADAGRAAQAETEREFLVRELARAFGLSGRARRAASASERARASVTRAVRQSMARIEQLHPRLGEHLSRTVRTGTYCGYFPDPRAPADWSL
jgi:tetratricopeptide (TPR) repeat protein